MSINAHDPKNIHSSDRGESSAGNSDLLSGGEGFEKSGLKMRKTLEIL